MIENIISEIQSAFGAHAAEKSTVNSLQPQISIDPQYLVAICKWLRDHPSYYFDFLADLAAVDYFPENRFAVVYNITSIPYQKQLTLRVDLQQERSLERMPVVPSVSSVWRTADWHEREAFDLMGIYFTDHPDLRRILMPDDWEGFPLRKDYQDPTEYHGIPVK